MESVILQRRPELAQPPVRRVRITFYVSGLHQLRLSALSGFIESQRAAYPDVSEEFPLPTIDDASGHASYVTGEVPLPFPLVTMSGNAGGHEINFQTDRFSLCWEFGNEGEDARYPGYEVLREQFAEAFRQFVTAAGDATGSQVEVTSAQCVYHNSITELPGANLAVYLLTGEETTTTRTILGSRSYAGARIRFPLEVNSFEHRVSAGVDSPDDAKTDLWIKVSTSSSENTVEALEVLDSAHEEVIKNFVAFIPDWLLESWGRVR